MTYGWAILTAMVIIAVLVYYFDFDGSDRVSFNGGYQIFPNGIVYVENDNERFYEKIDIGSSHIQVLKDAGNYDIWFLDEENPEMSLSFSFDNRSGEASFYVTNWTCFQSSKFHCEIEEYNFVLEDLKDEKYKDY